MVNSPRKLLISPNSLQEKTDVGFNFEFLGSFEVCIDISLVLLGVLLIQVLFYFEHFTKDMRRTKVLVIFLMSVEVCHSILITSSLYIYTISRVPHLVPENNLTPPLKLAILCSSLVDLTFEYYCGYRIRIKSQRWEFPIICWFIATARFACAITFVSITLSGDFVNIVTNKIGIFIAPLLSDVVVRSIIVVILAYYEFYKGTRLQRNKLTLRRCLIFSVESGVISWVLSIAMLVLAWKGRRDLGFIWGALDFIIAKTNSNSIMISLNRRHLVSDSYYRYDQTRRQRSLSFPLSPRTVTNITMKTQIHKSTDPERSDISTFDHNDICLVEMSRDQKQNGGAKNILSSEL